MNKKVVIIVVIIECIAAILLVSFWGKMIEALNPVVVPTEVYFVDDAGNKIQNNAVIHLQLTDSNRDYQLRWVVKPDNATEKGVEFIFGSENAEDNAVISNSGRVTFFTDNAVTVIIRTKDGAQKASIILMPNRS